ncbi:helix-turn-helix domain-containing protein [Gracilibacillus xinjiangensis]|uniref:Helix-turn-helix domain-containing protein n=1 Tax=Gracilibacillus xinjiangensis TaxID=1193282 RepID=A0ABV8WX22_9BACI
MGDNLFGERLRKLRQKEKLTMKQFGRKFALAESTISGYENGNRKPDLELVIKFADFFDVSIDYLAGRDDGNFIDIKGLTEDEIADIKRHIDYVKWKAKEEREGSE